MTLPLQFVSLYDRQEVFVWSNCPLDLGTDFLVGNGMEISAEKTKLMTNNTSGSNTEIKVNGQKLQTVTSSKYLGSVITEVGFKPEILSRIAQTSAALTRLKPVWIDKSISLSSKIRLMRSFVTSIFL